jgi:HEAT repeat protein
MSETFRDVLKNLATDDILHTAHLYALSKMDEAALATFREGWPSIPVQRRRDILQELLEITEINFEVDFDPVFLLGLGDLDAEVRAKSVKCLWEHEKPSLIRPMIHLLKTDDAVIVRAAAASALGKFIYLRELEETDPNEATLAEEALLQTIYRGDEDPEVRRRAIEAVAFSSDKRIPPIIESAYYSDNEKMQVSAIFSMGRNADARWLPQVISELDNPNTEIRFEACRSCGELEARDAVEKLVVLLDEDPDIEVQEMVVWALGKIGGQTAREVLEACLEHENEVLAVAAEEALEEINLFDDSLMLYDFGEQLDEDDDLLDLDDFNGSYSAGDFPN